MINKAVIFKFFTDFTNHTKKANKVVVFRGKALMQGLQMRYFNNLEKQIPAEHILKRSSNTHESWGTKFFISEKCFLFYLKSSFLSQNIQIFVFLTFPLFLPVGNCFRGWSKVNLKVHDVINCQNKSSITHFVWYLDKEKRYIWHSNLVHRWGVR